MYKVKPKKPRFFLFTVGLFLLAILGVVVGYAGAKITDNIKKSQLTPENISAATQEPTFPAAEISKTVLLDENPKKETLHENQYMYLIKLEDNKTKVYTFSDSTMTYSHDLPINTADLLPNDLETLKKGIYLKTKDELLSFTEDFCS